VHQPGIATPQPDSMLLAAFELREPAANVLSAWTREAEPLLSRELTVTFGLGARAFTAGTRPVALRELPAFPGDALDPRLCGGDVAVQACSRTPRMPPQH
jgi:deferrochelatase/peroxidase EfeB